MLKLSFYKKIVLVVAILAISLTLVQNLNAKSKNSNSSKDIKVEKIRFFISSPKSTGWDKKTRALGGVIKKLGLIKNVSYENIFYENPQENEKLMDFKGVHELIEHASKNKDAMLMFSNEIIVKYIQKASQYSFKDMAPIASFLTNNRIFVVRSDSPYNNWEKFLKAYKTNYENNKLMPKVGGWGSSGSVSYLVFAKAIDAAGGDIVYINYRGFQGTNLKKALDEKKVDLIVTIPYSKLIKEHKEGKIKIIAITSEKDLYIDGLKKPIPSFKASLGADVVYKDWSGLFAIPNLDPKLATAYANIIKKALQSKEWKAIAKKNQWTTFFKPQMEFGKFLKFQTEDFRDIMKKMNII